MATVTLLDAAREQLSELPRVVVLRIEKLFARLGRWPDVSGVKYLRGDLAGKCRLRTGDYRVQFHVEEKKRRPKAKQAVKGKDMVEEKEVTDHTVVIEKIGHRDRF